MPGGREAADRRARRPAGSSTTTTFENNDNPNVPAQGSAAAGPVGTGASLEGRDDTVMDNKFINNGAWGVVFEPYPDSGTPPRT